MSSGRLGGGLGGCPGPCTGGRAVGRRASAGTEVERRRGDLQRGLNGGHVGLSRRRDLGHGVVLRVPGNRGPLGVRVGVSLDREDVVLGTILEPVLPVVVRRVDEVLVHIVALGLVPDEGGLGACCAVVAVVGALAGHLGVGGERLSPSVTGDIATEASLHHLRLTAESAVDPVPRAEASLRRAGRKAGGDLEARSLEPRALIVDGDDDHLGRVELAGVALVPDRDRAALDVLELRSVIAVLAVSHAVGAARALLVSVVAERVAPSREMTVAAELGVQVSAGDELDKLAVNGRLVDLAVKPPAAGTILLPLEEGVGEVLRVPVVAVGSVLALETELLVSARVRQTHPNTAGCQRAMWPSAGVARPIAATRLRSLGAIVRNLENVLYKRVNTTLYSVLQEGAQVPDHTQK